MLALERVDARDGEVALRVTFEEADAEVVLGRGPLLQITDRKISRRHCKVVFSPGRDDNDPFWKLQAAADAPTAAEAGRRVGQGEPNPTTRSTTSYHLPSGSLDAEDWRPVEDEVRLESGDQISLAKGAYVYKVQVVRKDNRQRASDEDLKTSENQGAGTSSDDRRPAGEPVQPDRAAPPSNGSATSDDAGREDDMSGLVSSARSPALSNEEVATGHVEEENPLSRHCPIDGRRSCPFGEACYRKNPQHRVEEAHPGDPDYRQPEVAQGAAAASGDNDDDGDPRPECEYGLDCYRNNPQHRNDFKHTARPRPKRKVKEKAAGVKKKAKAGQDEYESDFIDDDDDDEEESDRQDISSDEEDVDEWLPDDDE